MTATETVERNSGLYHTFQNKFLDSINYSHFVNLLPSYSNDEIFSFFKMDDVLMNLILINLLNFRSRFPNEGCDFLVPTFIPTNLKDDAFFKLVNLFFTSTESEMKDLAQKLYELFGSGNDFTFDYFVKVFFPNIYQQFLSINNCASAAAILKSLIKICKENPNAINFTTNLVSTFLLKCYPFIQEFRQNLTYETLYVGVNDFDSGIKTQFLDSFSNSIIYLTTHHISILQDYFTQLPEKKHLLIEKLFTDLFSNVKQMNQFIFRNLVLDKEDVSNEMIKLIDELIQKSASSGYDFPDYESDLFYKDNIRFSLTRADICILSMINDHLEHHFKIFKSDNTLLPQITMNDAFSILYRTRKFEANQKSKPSVNLGIEKTKIVKWEAIKEKASIMGVDPISLLNFKDENTTACLEVLIKECEADNQLSEILRQRMKSVTYVNQIKPLISQLLRETYFSYAKFDLDNQSKVDIKTKWQTFSVNFLNANTNRYLNDSGKASKLHDKGLKLIANTKFDIQPGEDFDNFVQYFTDFQNAILKPYDDKTKFEYKVNLPNRKEYQQKLSQEPNAKAAPNKYSNMFHWLQTVLQYERLFSFTISAKEDPKYVFNTDQNTPNLINPHYKVYNLLKLASDKLTEESKKIQEEYAKLGALKKITASLQFSNDFIANFVVTINEIFLEIDDWMKTNEEQAAYINSANTNDDQDDEPNPNMFTGDDDDDDDDDGGLDFSVNYGDIIFSRELEFSKMYRIMKAVAEQNTLQIPPELHDSLTAMIKFFVERQTNNK